MNGILRHPIALAICALLALILVGSAVTIVPETSQAVILRFEQPVRTINAYQKGERFGSTGAGPIVRIPFIDRVVRVDKRILDVDLDNQPVLSSDQLPLEVDAYARFRIVDPLKMVVTVRSEEGVIAALQPLLANSIRNELGNQPSSTLLTPERERVMENIQARLQRLASQYGVAIVDVRIKHADLPKGSPMQSALDRMKSARKQQATTIRAQGNRDAQIIRGDAEAKAAAIYAASFNKDPEFYDFYRAMQSYRSTFAAGAQSPGATSIILSPENSYLKQFIGRK